MTNLKEKAKNFWKENKVRIVVAGGTTIGIMVIGGALSKAYRSGITDGAMIGFHATLDWLDKTFPEESKANELYEMYRITHPDKIVYRKGIGKWS